MTGPRKDDRPLDLGDVPAEEDISAADAAERVDKDPDEQRWDKDRAEPEVYVEETDLPDDPPPPGDIRTRT